MSPKQFKGIVLYSQIMFLVLLLNGVYAQGPVVLTNEQSGNFNNVKKYLNESPNADSAFFYIQKFSRNPTKETRGLLSDEMHYSLALMLIDTSGNNDPGKMAGINKKREFATTLLSLLTRDTTSTAGRMVRPLSFWMQIKGSENPALTEKLTDDFIKNDVVSADLYDSKSGRYGVLIYKNLISNPGMAQVSERLYAALSKQFGKDPIAVTESTPFNDLRKRSWLRYMYASLNVLKANSTGDFNEKEASLKTAFENSPDRIDLTNYGFYYDMPFLFGADKISFQNDYLSFLVGQKADNSKLTAVLLEMSLADPTYKKQLKDVYSQVESNKANFDAYWLENVNSRSAAIPPIELAMLDDAKFTGKESSGKWVLVDFWGTWCAPCREEHPDLENLFQSYVKPKQDKMTVLTIACNDKKDKVVNYIQEKKFTFPVAMSDGKVEKDFAVTYYPTKLLITPQGKYLRVPNGKNWVEFVKLYTGL